MERKTLRRANDEFALEEDITENSKQGGRGRTRS